MPAGQPFGHVRLTGINADWRPSDCVRSKRLECWRSVGRVWDQTCRPRFLGGPGLSDAYVVDFECSETTPTFGSGLWDFGRPDRFRQIWLPVLDDKYIQIVRSRYLGPIC